MQAEVRITAMLPDATANSLDGEGSLSQPHATVFASQIKPWAFTDASGAKSALSCRSALCQVFVRL
jgi:hypothetical protein